MQRQRRVSLPVPARTTHMNGGPRLRAGTPLPPYRASSWPRMPAAAPVEEAHNGTAEPDVQATQPGPGSRPYSPPAIVDETPVFPMDAFIIPEGAARLPCVADDEAAIVELPPGPATSDEVAQAAVALPGLVDTAPVALREEGPRRARSASLREERAHDVADRLDSLASQLRQHGYEVLAQRSVHGDALDALLAGVIAGYLVAAE